MHPNVNRRVDAARAILARPIGAISNALGVPMREEIRIRKGARLLIEAQEKKTAGDEIRTELAITGIDMPRTSGSAGGGRPETRATSFNVQARAAGQQIREHLNRYQIGCGAQFSRDYNCGDKGWTEPYARQFCGDCQSCAGTSE